MTYFRLGFAALYFTLSSFRDGTESNLTIPSARRRDFFPIQSEIESKSKTKTGTESGRWCMCIKERRCKTWNRRWFLGEILWEGSYRRSLVVTWGCRRCSAS